MTPATVLLTSDEAAALIGVGLRTFRRWQAQGRIRPARRVGASYLFTADEVRRVIALPRPRPGRPPKRPLQLDQQRQPQHALGRAS